MQGGGFHTIGIALVARLAIVSAAILVLSGGSARGAGLIGGTYDFTLDKTTDKNESGTIRSERSKHTLDLRYKGFMSPVIQNELTLKVEALRDSTGPDTVKVSPGIFLGYKGSYWNAGARRLIEDSNEPGREPSITDAYFVEVFIVPPRRLPDFKGKYTLDTSFQSGTTDTSRMAWTLSSGYRPYEWLDLKGDYSRNLFFDRLRPDSDTEEEKISGMGGIRHFISGKIKLDVQYRVEKNTGATLLSAGGAKNQKEDETQTVKNLVSFRPFRDTSLDASYDGEFKKNSISGENDQTNNFKVIASQKIGVPYDVRAEAGRNISEVRQTMDDLRKTEDTLTLDTRARYSQMFDFSARYSKKDTKEDHFFDPLKNTSSGNVEQSATWVALVLPTFSTSVSYSRNDIFTKGAKTSIDTRYNIRGNIALKYISLTIEPSYEFALKDDLVAILNTETRDIRVVITYKMFETKNINSMLSHTYARKQSRTYPGQDDPLANNINRTDTTSANITWKDPLPGWMVGIDVSRNATDTSRDENPPDITTNYGLKASYKYRMLTFDTSYKYDHKSVPPNRKSFDMKVGWTTASWDANLTYTYNKTFPTNKTEGQIIGFAFRYAF